MWMRRGLHMHDTEQLLYTMNPTNTELSMRSRKILCMRPTEGSAMEVEYTEHNLYASGEMNAI